MGHSSHSSHWSQPGTRAWVQATKPSNQATPAKMAPEKTRTLTSSGTTTKRRSPAWVISPIPLTR